MWDFLSTDERYRASRHRDRKRAEHFIVRRGLLRCIVGRQLNLLPGNVELIRACEWCGGQHGRLRLGTGMPRSTEFSVSSSGALCVLAMSPARVGVDVEHRRQPPARSAFWRRLLTPSELASIDQTGHPAGDCTRMLRAIWMRKEAAGKAWGVGLGYPLAAVEVKDMATVHAPACLVGAPPLWLRDISLDGAAHIRPSDCALASAQPMGVVLVRSVDHATFRSLTVDG